MPKKKTSQPTDTYLPTDDGGYAKPRRITKGEAIEKAEMYIAKNLPKYAKKLHQLAMGILVEGIKRGEPIVYAIPPDRAALEYLMERGMGKAPTRLELTGADGGGLVVVPWLPADVIEGEVIHEPTDARTLSSPSASLVQEQGEEQD